jgi:hypothetical protein
VGQTPLSGEVKKVHPGRTAVDKRYSIMVDQLEVFKTSFEETNDIYGDEVIELGKIAGLCKQEVRHQLTSIILLLWVITRLYNSVTLNIHLFGQFICNYVMI